MISFLSHRIALFLRNNDIVDDETAQVCQYGFEIIISTLVGFLIVLFIGICCGELLSGILFYALFVGVRLSTGGYHATTHLMCKLLLCVCCLSTLLTTIFFEEYYNIKVQSIIILFYLLTVFLFSPIEHPNAPLDNFTMKRNRGISIIVSFALSLCTLAGNVLGVTASASTTFTSFYAPANISGQYNALSQNGIQYKSTSNSVYIHLTSASNGAWVQTWGLNGSSWSSSGSNLTYSYATGSLTTSHVLSIGDNYVPNLIHESSKYYCGLKFCSGSYYYDSYLTGYWSAD